MLKFETDRLIVRKFENSDMEALYQLLKDKEVNTFLPWFPIKNRKEAKDFYEIQFCDLLKRELSNWIYKSKYR